jgi:hypothetical protein
MDNCCSTDTYCLRKQQLRRVSVHIKLLILGNLDGKQKKKGTVINSVILYLVFLHCHGHGHTVLFDNHFFGPGFLQR